MRYGLALILFIVLVACATNPPSDSAPSRQMATEKANDAEEEKATHSEQVVKSPQGYVIKGPKARFGGFIGDCASDENFPYYWECQEENSGNGYH